MIKSNLTRLSVFAVLAAVVVVGYLLLGDRLSLKYLAEQEAQLRQLREDRPGLTYGIAFGAYVLFTGLSVPVATVLSLLYGWFFGALPAIVLVSFAATAGATLAFWLSRYLLRDFVQSHFRKRLIWLNAALEHDGAFVLFMLRLLPLVPYVVLNSVAGLTPLKTRTFWWASQLGMLPGSAIYIYAGSVVPSLEVLAEEGVFAAFTRTQLLQIFVAFSLLGVFPLALRWTLRWLGWTKSIEAVTASEKPSE